MHKAKYPAKNKPKIATAKNKMEVAVLPQCLLQTQKSIAPYVLYWIYYLLYFLFNHIIWPLLTAWPVDLSLFSLIIQFFVEHSTCTSV